MAERTLANGKRKGRAKHTDSMGRTIGQQIFGWAISILVLLAFLFFPYWIPRIPSFFQAIFPPGQQFHVGEYNADIAINRDASFSITETIAYSYDRGSFRRGLREIPLDRVGTIDGVGVGEEINGRIVPYSLSAFNPDNRADSGVPGTYGSTVEGNKLRVRWVYTPTSGGSARTFRVSYRVAGAVRVYSDHDLFGWYAVPPDWASPVNASRVRVTLLDETDLGSLDVLSTPIAPIQKEGNAVTWTVNGGLDDGLDVQLVMPKGTVQAIEPPWQAEYEAQQAYKRNVVAPTNFALFALGALSLVFGPVGMLLRWYRHGRKKPTKPFSDYVTEPPSDLPPGLVGALVGNQGNLAASNELAATIVDLARKGKIAIKELSLLPRKDFEYTLLSRDVEHGFERELLDVIFKSKDHMRLSDLKKGGFASPSLSAIHEEMNGALVARGFWAPNRMDADKPYLLGGCLFMLLAVVGYIGAFTFLAGDFTLGLAALSLGVGVAGYVGLTINDMMDRTPEKGVEEIEKWQAFSRYLKTIKKFEGLEAADEKLEKYLPYAIALEVEKQFFGQFDEVEVETPDWYTVESPVTDDGNDDRHRRDREMSARERAAHSAGANVGANVVRRPSSIVDLGSAVQGMSDSLGGGIQGLSDSLAEMVTYTADTFSSRPASERRSVSRGSSSGRSSSSSSRSSSSSSSSSSSRGGSSGGGGGGAD